MVDWKECEHENIDTQAMANPNCLDDLWNNGILKFFLSLGMWDQPEMLWYLISLWDMNREIFVIGDQELEL